MKSKIILITIILLSFFLRFYKLDSDPPSLYWDEVSIGYNAYSVLESGKDEWGRQYPVFFEAFNEYKFPVSIYLTVFSIKIFGFTDLAVRFPSAFFGVLTIFILFLFTKNILQIFWEKKLTSAASTKISLLAAFFISVSMWHLQFSRALFEANIALFFQLLTVFLWLKLLTTKNKILIVPFAVSLLLTVYSYSIQILLMAFLLTAFLCFVKIKLRAKIKWFVVLCAIYFLIEIPFLLHVKKNGFTRFEQVSIFSQNDILKNIISWRAKYGVMSKIVFNRYTAGAVNFLNNYPMHFDLRFLYPGADANYRHSAGLGLMFPLEIVFLFWGIFFLLKYKQHLAVLLAAVIGLCMVPVAFTREGHSALRTLNILPFYMLLISIGLYSLLRVKGKIINLIVIGIIASSAFSFQHYLSTYYFDYPTLRFNAWGYENKLMMEENRKINLKNKTTYFTGYYWRPYIYYYYEYAISPELVQKNNNSTRLSNVWFGYASFDRADRRYNYNFNLTSLFDKKNVILFLSPEEETNNFVALKEKGFYFVKKVYHNGEHVISIYEKDS